MNQKQKDIVEGFRKEYLDNCVENEIFGSQKICSFRIMTPTREADASVTILWNKITGLSNDMIPESVLLSYNITADGNVVNMDDILNFKQLNTYLAGLKEYEQ
jgi:hypothetical protein